MIVFIVFGVVGMDGMGHVSGDEETFTETFFEGCGRSFTVFTGGEGRETGENSREKVGICPLSAETSDFLWSLEYASAERQYLMIKETDYTNRFIVFKSRSLLNCFNSTE
jgi:hypothetical protein